MHLKDVALGAIEPGDHEEIVPDRDPVRRRARPAVEPGTPIGRSSNLPLMPPSYPHTIIWHSLEQRPGGPAAASQQ